MKYLDLKKKMNNHLYSVLYVCKIYMQVLVNAQTVFGRILTKWIIVGFERGMNWVCGR